MQVFFSKVGTKILCRHAG
uniref:Uncharacterized protein n=1 Tax=Anguilla anguilla TaxID=7936 RepID=A0A0E9VGN1_ANGAN